MQPQQNTALSSLSASQLDKEKPLIISPEIKPSIPSNTYMQTSLPPLNSSFILPCISNFQSDDVEMLKPWEFNEVEHSSLKTKDDYKAYLTNRATKSCLYSGVLGLNPTQRVSRYNPATRLVAIITDSDIVMQSEDDRKKFLSRLKVKPSYYSSSYSNGTHAIWLLEKPLPILPDAPYQKALLKQIAKDLKLTEAFGGIDTKAFYNLSQVYHVGWAWQEGGGTPIPETRTRLWLEVALKKARLGDDSLAIPLERVAEEVHRRFPNRWEGDFEIGARGCRFWDEQADNPTAAVVTQKGMICYTGSYPFRSWLNIFGEEFVEKYKQDTYGVALRDCYFINNRFYAKVPMIAPDGTSTPIWQCFNRQNFESFLASTYGLRAYANKDLAEQESQIKVAIGSIVSQKSLSGTMPFIYNENDVVKMGDKVFLNTSFIRVLQPDQTASTQWAESFAWIASFLETLFPNIKQRERFISEWAYAYQHAYEGNPRNGRTIFIAGDAGVGKNFLTEVLIGASLGGYVDASDYLLGASRFNEHLFRSGVWVLNDTVSREDWRESAHFSKMLKKMAANISHHVEGKFKDAVNMNWSGRMYITLNTDPFSLALLPEMDMSNRDKISLYRTSDVVMNDPMAFQKAQQELPAFCNYLLTLEHPEHCKGTPRWGVKGYLHPELYEAAESRSRAAIFEEIFDMYVESVFEADKRCQQIESSSAAMHGDIKNDSYFSPLIESFPQKSFQNHLAALSAKGYPITRDRNSRKRKWIIKREDWMLYQEQKRESTLDDELL